MAHLETILSNEIVRPIGWTLVHFLWQASSAAVVLWGLLRIFGKASSNVRYCIACAALLVLVSMPVVTFCMLYEPPVEVAAPPAIPAAVEPASVPETVTVTVKPTVIAAEPVTSRPLKTIVAEKIEAVLPACVLVWLVGVAALSLWYLGGWCQLQKLRRIGTRTVSQAVAAKASDLAARLGIRRGVQIVESALVQVPTVIGALKPIVLLPATALTGLDEVQLSALIAHELAHVKRCDYLINILQTIVEILGFYHPALWWISRQIRIERENCCDDMAVALLQSKKDYAGALFTMETIRAKQLELAVAANGGHLTNRITRLVEKEIKHPKPGWIPSTIAILLSAALFITAAIAMNNETEQKKAPTKQELKALFAEVEQALISRDVQQIDNCLYFENESNRQRALELIQQEPYEESGLFESVHIVEIQPQSDGSYEVCYLIAPSKNCYPPRSWTVVSHNGRYKLELFDEAFFDTQYASKTMSSDEISQRILGKLIRQWETAEGEDLRKLIQTGIENCERSLRACEYAKANGLSLIPMNPPYQEQIQSQLDKYRNTPPEQLKQEMIAECKAQLEEHKKPASSRNSKLGKAAKADSAEVSEKAEEGIRVYAVNRSVADFPEAEDFSTPESAYAAINRVMAAEEYDLEGWKRVSASSLADRMSKPKSTRKTDPEWANVCLNARILEVRIKGARAIVLAELPQSFSSKPIRNPIDSRYLQFENGQWLNTGEDRFDSVEVAAAKFDRINRERNEADQKHHNVLDKAELLKGLAQELFNKLETADYEAILKNYDQESGTWQRDGWKKLGIDYCVHTDWPSFALWVCRTFKDNPIQSVELGEVFISDKQLMGHENKAPAIPYKLTLKDGGVLEGDLYFAYRASRQDWQPTEGIDWHLQKSPVMRKADADNDKSMESMQHLKQLALAWYMYADENANDIAESLDKLKPYLERDEYSWLQEHAVLLEIPFGFSYIRHPAQMPIAYDKTFLAEHGRRVVAFADGHIEIDNNDSLKEVLDKAILSNRVESARKLKDIGFALTMWLNNHDDVFPDSIGKIEFKNEALKPWAEKNVEYIGAGKVLSDIQNGGQTAVAYDKTLLNTADGTNLLFADGHVEFCEKENFKDFEVLNEDEEVTDRVKWSECNAAMGILRIGIRVWEAKKRDAGIRLEGSWTRDEITLEDLGFLPKDFNGKYFSEQNYSWQVSCFPPDYKLKITITATAGKGMPPSAWATLDETGRFDWGYGKPLHSGMTSPDMEQTTGTQQILTMGYLITVPADTPLLEDDFPKDNPIVISPEKLQGLLADIANNPKATMLATPRLMSHDNEAATIAIVEDIPFSDKDGKIEYKEEIGVKLSVTPHLSPKGHIRTEIGFEYSYVVNQKEQKVNSTTIQAEMAMPDGETIMLKPIEIKKDGETAEILYCILKIEKVKSADAAELPRSMISGVGNTADDPLGASDRQSTEIHYPRNWDEIVKKRQQQESAKNTLLETKIDFSGLGANSTIQEAVDYIRKSTKPPLTIVVLWGDLSENAFIERDTPIAVDGLGLMTLQAGLRAITRSLSSSEISDVGYIIENGILTIATKASLPKQFSNKTYDVTDLVVRPGAFAGGYEEPTAAAQRMQDKQCQRMQELERSIVETIASASWYENGGEGRLDQYGNTKLIIWQSPEVHQKIEDFLVAERQDRGRQVAIEARFLLVDDNFLEDVGFDLSLLDEYKTSGGMGEVVIGPANSKEILAALEDKPLPEGKSPLPGSHNQILAMDDQQSKLIIQSVQGHPDAKTVTAPKAMVLNGEAARMQIYTNKKYRAEERKNTRGGAVWLESSAEGQEKEVEVGIRLDIQPTVTEDRKYVLLRGHIRYSNIIDRQTQDENENTDGIPLMQVINIPVYATTGSGETIFVVGPELTISKDVQEETDKPDKQRLLIMVKPTVILQEEQEPESAIGRLGGDAILGAATIDWPPDEPKGK